MGVEQNIIRVLENNLNSGLFSVDFKITPSYFSGWICNSNNPKVAGFNIIFDDGHLDLSDTMKSLVSFKDNRYFRSKKYNPWIIIDHFFDEKFQVIYNNTFCEYLPTVDEVISKMKANRRDISIELLLKSEKEAANTK